MRNKVQSPLCLHFRFLQTGFLFGFVFDILALAAEFEFISFVWISRLQNMVADELAKQSLVVNEGDPLTY